MENTSLATRLKLFRQSTGKTQAEFGEACGISQRTYANLEGGRTQKISGDYLSRIESAFKQLSPNWLRHGAGNMLREAHQPSVGEVVAPKQPERKFKAPVMLVIPDVSHLTPEEQAEYWQAKWEKLAREKAERQAAEEHDETIQFLRTRGGNFHKASADAADTCPTVYMVAVTNHDYQRYQAQPVAPMQPTPIRRWGSEMQASLR